MTDRLRCPGCNEYFSTNNMRLVKDVYWCDSCREARKKKG